MELDDPKMYEAMETAKQAIRAMYRGEKLSDLEVEELEQDFEGNWIITVGVTRPKTRQTLGGLTIPIHTLKRVTVDSEGEFVQSIKMYQPDK